MPDQETRATAQPASSSRTIAVTVPTEDEEPRPPVHRAATSPHAVTKGRGPRSRPRSRLLTLRFLSYAALVALAVVWLLPIVYAFTTSFRSPTEIASSGFELLPTHWVVMNYSKLMAGASSYPVVQWFVNSMVISVSHAVLMVVVVALAGYGYARMNFRGRDTLFFVLLAISLFPTVVNIIPSYKIVQTLGWVNSPLAVIVPGLGGVANIFLVRNFMIGLPKELDEAATIDGANEFQIFGRVILPLIRPVLIVVLLFSFTGSWNDFLWPTIVFNDVDRMPITAGLQLLQDMFGGYSSIGQLMASSMLAMIPTMLLFLVAQKYFVESMNITSGVKG